VGSWDPPLDFYRDLSSKHSIANGKAQSNRIDRKVDLHATTPPYNSYKLNAQPKYNIKKLKDKDIG
jgi:DNA modification methylase